MDEPVRGGVSPVEGAFAALVATLGSEVRVVYRTGASLHHDGDARSVAGSGHRRPGRGDRPTTTRIVLRAGMDVGDPLAARPRAERPEPPG